MKNKTFTCVICKELFDCAWTDEEAIEELEIMFGFGMDDVSLCEVVCDDCYKKFMKRKAMVG